MAFTRATCERLEIRYRYPADFERAWSGLVHCGDAVRRMAFLARFTRRMWNASEFMKTLKQSSINI